MSAIPEIKYTTDYTVFERSPDNREVDLRRCKEIAESMKRVGFVPTKHIECHRNGSGLLKIDDGQHRFHAAKMAGVGVFYTEFECVLSNAEANRMQKSWKLHDYVGVWAEKGYGDYKEAIEFCNRTEMSLAHSLGALAGLASPHSHKVMEAAKRGEFIVQDRKYAERVASMFTPTLLLSKHINRRAFVEACMMACCIADFDIGRFIKNATKNSDKLVSCSKKDGYLQIIEDIYNWKRSVDSKEPIAHLAMQAAKARR